MKVVSQLEAMGRSSRALVMAVGSFDGVHRGHQRILVQTRAQAAHEQAEAWVLTFDPHPARIIRPQTAPALLTCTEHKLQLLQAQALDGCLVLPFTRELSVLEPDAFIDHLCAHLPGLRGFVVGTNWTFGHRARGNAVVLQELAQHRRFQVQVVDPVYWKGAPISSTRIRQEVARGHLAAATELLGRPFSVLGVVVPGRQRGRAFGYPTANLDPRNEVRPPPGIYAVYALLDGRRYDGVAYCGGGEGIVSAPHPRVVEVHLLDADLDLYGRELEVFFVAGLRANRRFDSTEALRAQIAVDIQQARALLRPAP